MLRSFPPTFRTRIYKSLIKIRWRPQKLVNHATKSVVKALDPEFYEAAAEGHKERQYPECKRNVSLCGPPNSSASHKSSDEGN